jgi:hypothetical protein
MKCSRAKDTGDEHGGGDGTEHGAQVADAARGDVRGQLVRQHGVEDGVHAAQPEG